MKHVFAFILLITICLTVQAQRIRDKTTASTYDSTAYLVIDKAGWGDYKKIRADVLMTGATTSLSEYVDSIRTVLGTTNLAYVPFATSHYIQSADFTYRVLAQNIKNSTFILDYVLDSVSNSLRVLKDTSTYRIINVTNEIGVRMAGSQFKTTTNKFLMSGVSGTGNSTAYIAFLDTAGDKRHFIAVDTTKIALRFNQTIAGAGDFDGINMQDTGMIFQRKKLTVNNYISLDDAGVDIFMKNEKVIIVDSSGYFYPKYITQAYGGFQDSSYSISLTATNWAHLTNATNTLWTFPEQGNITESNDTITIADIRTGDYTGVLSLSFAGTNADEYQVRIYNVTSVRAEGFHIGTTAITGVNSVLTLPIHIECDIKDSKIVVQVRNITNNNAMVVKHCSLILQLQHFE